VVPKRALYGENSPDKDAKEPYYRALLTRAPLPPLLPPPPLLHLLHLLTSGGDARTRLDLVAELYDTMVSAEVS
jgi:hypothetical protein